MPAFGNADWPKNYGECAGINKNSITHATGTGATEGTNQLTYVVELDGLYRVSSALRVRTAGTGAGQVASAQVAYNNGTAVSAATVALSGVTPGTLDATAAAGTALGQSGVYKAVAGTNIVVSILGAGTFTTAAVIDWYASVERV